MIQKATRRCRLPAITLLAAALGACGNQPDRLTAVPPLDPSDIPPTPTNVVAQVSSSTVTLSWTVSSPAGVTEYRVYRAEDTEAMFQYLASTGQTAYSDQQVVNGVAYRYQIAALKGALEGERSATVSAVPNAISLVLEGGAAVVAP